MSDLKPLIIKRSGLPAWRAKIRSLFKTTSQLVRADAFESGAFSRLGDLGQMWKRNVWLEGSADIKDLRIIAPKFIDAKFDPKKPCSAVGNVWPHEKWPFLKGSSVWYIWQGRVGKGVVSYYWPARPIDRRTGLGHSCLGGYNIRNNGRSDLPDPSNVFADSPFGQMQLAQFILTRLKTKVAELNSKHGEELSELEDRINTMTLVAEGRLSL